jgi:hypothetical protein
MMNEIGNCPICKVPLSIKNIDNDNKYTLKFCSSCHKEYFQIEGETRNNLEYDDIETLSEEANDGPVLLVDDKDYTAFPGRKKSSYLEGYFDSHVTIETREYIQE